MTQLNNSISGAALCLGVNPEDLAAILPALQAAKEARESGIRIQWTVDPTLAREDSRPVLMASFVLETITYHKSTLCVDPNFPEPPQPKPGFVYRNRLLDSLTNTFFGPKSSNPNPPASNDH